MPLNSLGCMNGGRVQPARHAKSKVETFPFFGALSPERLAYECARRNFYKDPKRAGETGERDKFR